MRLWNALAFAAVSTVASACADRAAPVAPAPSAPLTASAVAQVQATPALTWLAPLGTGTADPATFDATAAPAVEVCAWTGTSCSAAPVARFTTVPSGTNQSLTVNAAAGQYEASWDLMNAAFTTRHTYRIRVLQGATELGAVSVDVVRGRWALTRTDGTLAPVAAATTLPIRFTVAIPQVPETRLAAVALGADVAAAPVTQFCSLAGCTPRGGGAAQLRVPGDARGAFVFALTGAEDPVLAARVGAEEPATVVDARSTALAAVGMLLWPAIGGTPDLAPFDARVAAHPSFPALLTQIRALATAGTPYYDSPQAVALAATIARAVLLANPPVGPAVTASAPESWQGKASASRSASPAPASVMQVVTLPTYPFPAFPQFSEITIGDGLATDINLKNATPIFFDTRTFGHESRLHSVARNSWSRRSPSPCSERTAHLGSKPARPSARSTGTRAARRARSSRSRWRPSAWSR
jgi:hypothetical protein